MRSMNNWMPSSCVIPVVIWEKTMIFKLPKMEPLMQWYIALAFCFARSSVRAILAASTSLSVTEWYDSKTSLLLMEVIPCGAAASHLPSRART